MSKNKEEFRSIAVHPKIRLEETTYGWHIHLVDDSNEKFVDFLHNCVFQDIKEALQAVELIHVVIRAINITEGYHIIRLKKVE